MYRGKYEYMNRIDLALKMTPMQRDKIKKIIEQVCVSTCMCLADVYDMFASLAELGATAEQIIEAGSHEMREMYFLTKLAHKLARKRFETY